MGRKRLHVGVLLLAMLTLSACETEQTKYESCVARGIQYFKDWGTYPKLRNGKDAEEVARERCKYDYFAY